MAKLKIKKGDMVLVRAGADKGKRGEVLGVLPRENRAIVQGVRMAKRHQKPDAQNPDGGIVERESSIHISNLGLIDKKTGKASRVGWQREEKTGKVQRVLRSSGEVV